MPSSYTVSLRFVLPATGEDLNTWGQLLNASATSMIDSAIAGITSITTAGPQTLTTANGASDQARSAILDFSGMATGTYTIPAVSKVYKVRNTSGNTITLTTGSGRTASIAPNSTNATQGTTFICDGTNVDRGVNQTDIDAGVAAANAYANGLAFQSSSGQLPGQAGNAGKFLTTNGSTANWATPYTVGTTSGTVAAGDDSRWQTNANSAQAAQTTANAAMPKTGGDFSARPTITGQPEASIVLSGATYTANSGRITISTSAAPSSLAPGEIWIQTS